MMNFNPDDFNKQNNSADDSLLVKFFYKSVLDSTKTEEEGRPIYREVEYVDIKIAGERNGGACRPARQDDIERFPRHYEAFKNRVAMPEEGTPLIEWTGIPRTLADELAFANIKTVEALAATSDSNISNFAGVSQFKQKAKEFLKENEMQKEIAKQLSERDAEIAELRAMLDELTASKKPAKKKGK